MRLQWTTESTRYRTIWSSTSVCRQPEPRNRSSNQIGGHYGPIEKPSSQCWHCMWLGPVMWPITMACCSIYERSIAISSQPIPLRPDSAKYSAFFSHGFSWWERHEINGIGRVYSTSPPAFYRVLDFSFPKRVSSQLIRHFITFTFDFFKLIISINFISVPGNVYMILGMSLALLAKMATTCSQAVLVTCTGELVSPAKQKLCIFSCIVCARIGLLTAPFIGVVTFIHTLFPMAAFGVIGLIGGICTCLINYYQLKEPSTDEKKGMPPPSAEVYVIDNSAWWPSGPHITNRISITIGVLEWLSSSVILD